MSLFQQKIMLNYFCYNKTKILKFIAAAAVKNKNYYSDIIIISFQFSFFFAYIYIYIGKI